jgi:hypothetical protein
MVSNYFDGIISMELEKTCCILTLLIAAAVLAFLLLGKIKCKNSSVSSVKQSARSIQTPLPNACSPDCKFYYGCDECAKVCGRECCLDCH